MALPKGTLTTNAMQGVRSAFSKRQDKPKKSKLASAVQALLWEPNYPKEQRKHTAALSRHHVATPAITAGPVIAQLEYLAGRQAEGELYGFEGCALHVDAVVRRSRTGRFELCIKVGNDWFPVLDIAPGEPALTALRKEGHMVIAAPSPCALHHQQRNAKEERERLEFEEAQTRARHARHGAMIERSRAEQERRRAEARALRGG